MKKRIMIRFGDLMLKGFNIGYFIKRIRRHIESKLNDLQVTYIFRHDRIIIDYIIDDETIIIKRLGQIPGIYDYMIAHVCDQTIDAIIKEGIIVLDNLNVNHPITLKIETKRTDKRFPMTSLEISKTVAKPIIEGTKHTIKVDVNHPEHILYIDVRQEGCYLYLKRYQGMGGYPYGTAGKGLLMMSGGIDSPVAGYLAIKQGIEVELIHFESTPLTPIESVQKVIDLAKVLANYTMHHHIKLHLIPFFHIHEAIINHVFEPYMITIMRRMMYRIAHMYAKKQKIDCIINGESMGQVASQTLPSMKVVEAVTTLPILRPLITYDKLDIIKIAKHIETYETSIKPFNDCCSIYVPKQPVTKPMNIYAEKYENSFVFEPMIEEALKQRVTLIVHKDTDYPMDRFGLTVKEAFEAVNKDKGDDSDYIQTKPKI